MSNEVITFGCRLNNYETEVIKKALHDSEASNTIVFNTCAVTKEAERQALQAIRKTKRNFPDKKIIVTGCAAQLNPQKFAKLTEVDIVLGNEEKLHQHSYKQQEKILVNDIMSVRDTAEHLIASFDGKSRAFVQIQNGCNHRCTFCIIPYARGNNRSTEVSLIIKQVQQLIDAGYNEIVFTGVDISDYGIDLDGNITLAKMIKQILNSSPSLQRLRLSSIDVAEIDAELFELIAYEPRVMPHVHISLQSGDNMILKRMKRRHNREQVIEFCQKLREIRPNIAYGADIIAGFPTETDEMFNNSIDLVSAASIQYLHVFPYSKRDGTPASRMPQLDKDVIKSRASLLRKAGNTELDNFLNKQVGQKVSAIIEQNNLARAENFTTIQISEEAILGQVYNVNIIGYNNGQLFGTICSK